MNNKEFASRISLLNGSAVDTAAIIERCELFTRDHLPELARELNACKKGEPIKEDGRLKELYSKLLICPKLPAPPMQIAIAMVSNEAVNYVAGIVEVESTEEEIESVLSVSCPDCTAVTDTVCCNVCGKEFSLSEATRHAF